MTNDHGEKISGRFLFLYCAIAFGVISILMSSYITSDLGDLPSIAFAQLSLAVVTTVSGGAFGLLVRVLRNKRAWSAYLTIKVVILSLLVIPAIYGTYGFIKSASSLRIRLVNRYTLDEMHNYQNNISEYVSAKGKLPAKLDDLKSKVSDSTKISPLYQGLIVNYSLLSNNDGYSLRMHHKKGNKEFALLSDTEQIMWRIQGDVNWKPISTYEYAAEQKVAN